MTDTTGNPIESGSQVWQYEGRVYNRIALDAVAGLGEEALGLEPYRYDQIMPGCYDPTARLSDMDQDGVWGSLSFPTFPKFAGTRFLDGTDKALALECVRAYNDFIIDEWCAAAPDRYIPMIILPLWDIPESVAEIERCAVKGALSISFPENPVPLGLPSWHLGHWDPVFAAAEAAAMPLSMHFGTSGEVPTTGPDAPLPVSFVIMACNSAATMTDLLYSTVFDKFPNLKVALSEGGIGWIPYILERADMVWERHGGYTGLSKRMRPSDAFRKHIWGCFLHDEAGMRERHTIGVSQLMFESDFPHSDSVWPNARKRASELFSSVPDNEVHRIVELNARELYRFPA
jgi:predicted TIM-barrel fold metal-dependent hydrolase